MFQPVEDWPAGQSYSVTFDQSLFAPGVILAEEQASFTTPGFSAAIEELTFYQDPQEHTLRKVVATLEFTHPVNPQSLAQNLSYTMRESGDTIDTAPNRQRLLEDRHCEKLCD